MIPYPRQPKYLSPSSLYQFENEPLRFYLQRCGPEEFKPPYPQQTFPMGVGSAFDAVVKDALARELGLSCPPLAEMLTETVTCEDWEGAAKLGHQLLGAYRKCGAYDLLLSENPIEVWHEREQTTVPGTKTKANGGVPILGYRDCVTRPDPDGPPVVLDWKVTGSGGRNLAPKPGYNHCLDTSAPGVQHARKHKRRGEPMESLHQPWADQLAIYTWMLRGRLGVARVAIDQINVRQGGRVWVARYRTTVSSEHQHDLRRRLKAAWQAVVSGAVVEEPWASLGIDAVRVIA